MESTITFAPLLPLPLLAALALLSAGLVAFAVWRGLTGWWLRGLAALVLLAALADPRWREEDRAYLPDIAFVVTDATASQGIDVRPDQMGALMPELSARLQALAARAEAGLEIREISVTDAAGADAAQGSRLLSALAEAAAEVSEDRIAGAILVTDGQVHDPEALAAFPAPVHVILTGRADEWDRRLVMETAPAFAIVGEQVELRLRIETLGRAPADLPERVPLEVSVNGAEPLRFDILADTSQTLPLELDRGGMNVLQITVPTAQGELTERNNQAVLSINGIRDRLRVLLVSGEPYAGERTWRNLLKSDAAVDLVHFTILRPPEKQDGVPVFELSLIAFPTRELFMDKVDEFDLIIFDRYRRRGVLPSLYIENIARYVREGGAVLIASGPAFAGAESLYRTPLRDVLPAAPTARVLEEGFVPRVSAIGERHPVTNGLTDFAPRPTAEDGTPGWGRWFRLIDMEAMSGDTVMEGPEGRPLLVLDRPGEGRIAMLASDHAWLWSRGYEGGGPQQELLRRLAHWLMQEPELEEEVLRAEPDGAEVTVTRRTLGDTAAPVTVTGPSGETFALNLSEVAPGTWQARFAATENGIYRLSDGTIEAVTAVGPAAPKEFENPVSDRAVLAPLADTTGGGILRFDEVGTPDLRRVAENRTAEGRGWLGLVRRDAYDVQDIRLTALAPGWLMLFLAGALVLAAWRIEGR
ncbi:hypothetical protein HMH01_00145 [Halovulum dunhuangense]|uniref:Glutamine amidotransferase n=1 Tax=Halovulum dunhuangense TaxID=1505036 RepID=A0A849KP77_9RHOB|nr:hypothetical protein [Halovulum dunhuangense]NNU78833.1 hypothetical protein [Halovulum dunhuangense]